MRERERESDINERLRSPLNMVPRKCVVIIIPRILSNMGVEQGCVQTRVADAICRFEYAYLSGV